MSQESDNQLFASLEQSRLKALGLYAGNIDGWFGVASREAWRRSHAVEVPLPPVPGDLSKPAEFYSLPKESSAALTEFYGSPTESGAVYLEYFSFPCDGTRLYSRSGTILTNNYHRTHHLLVARTEGALKELYATLGDAEFRRQGWHVYGGSHNYRKKMGGSSLSTHAWAIASDWNPSENSYANTSTTFSDLAFDIWERWGFLSGFRAWGKDAMHFQAAIPNLSAGSYYSRNGFPKNIRSAT